MTNEEIRETRLKVLEKDLASINNRLHHAFNQGFELGRKSITPKEKTGHCNSCKWYDEDRMYNPNCENCCRNYEDNYCGTKMVEPQESENKE